MWDVLASALARPPLACPRHLPRREPLPKRAAGSKGIWEIQHEFGVQPGDGKVSVADGQMPEILETVHIG